MPAVFLLMVAAMTYTFVGCLTFILLYRPQRTWSHDVCGGNAVLLMWWVAIWVATSLVAAIVPMSAWVATLGQMVAWVGVGTVIWVHVALVVRTRREEVRR